ncbi:MAG: DNA repair protein RecO [Candidatus Hydrothermia bacterium]
MLRKEEIIALRLDEFMESSTIIWAYGRESGLFKILAKGARRVKSSLRMAFELFSVSEVIYYYKPERELNVLKEGKILLSGEKIVENVEKYELVSQCASYVLKAFPQGGGQNFYPMFKKLIHTLQLTSKVNRKLYYYMVLKNLKIQGEMPRFDLCSKCGSENVTFFSITSKLFLCHKCISEENNLLMVDAGILSELKFILEKDWHTLNSFEVRENTLKIIQNLSGDL